MDGESAGPHETPDDSGAHPRLDGEQIRALGRYGKRRTMQAGDVLFKAGERVSEFYVILAGTVAIVEGYGDENRVLSVHGPGRFLGELGLLTGQVTLVSAVVQQPGEVLTVPLHQLREVVARDAALGDLILRSCLYRRWARPGRPARCAISWSSAPDLPAWRPPSTAHPRAWTPWSSTACRPVARRELRPASTTTSGFRRGSRARSWPSALSSRPTGSG